jgi:hypothetical protein
VSFVACQVTSLTAPVAASVLHVSPYLHRACRLNKQENRQFHGLGELGCNAQVRQIKTPKTLIAIVVSPRRADNNLPRADLSPTSLARPRLGPAAEVVPSVLHWLPFDRQIAGSESRCEYLTPPLTASAPGEY